MRPTFPEAPYDKGAESPTMQRTIGLVGRMVSGERAGHTSNAPGASQLPCERLMMMDTTSLRFRLGLDFGRRPLVLGFEGRHMRGSRHARIAAIVRWRVRRMRELGLQFPRLLPSILTWVASCLPSLRSTPHIFFRCMLDFESLLALCCRPHCTRLNIQDSLEYKVHTACGTQDSSLLWCVRDEPSS